MPNKTFPIRTLYKNFQVFNVLDDSDTFSGADNSQILVYPADEDMNEDDYSDLENGRLPNNGSICSIDMTKLLNEAIKAKLDCVKPLINLIEGK